MIARALAPAKINLFLHVGPPGDDGYHPIDSLMTFADVGDRLSIAAAADQGLTVEGPCAAGLSAGEDNLVMRAARALLDRVGRPDAGFHLTLDKRLPVAAGLGGGSSDAGAALILLNVALDLGLAEPELEAIAATLGADGAACLRARPVIATGRGEQLGPAPRWPDMACVLVNPGLACPTPAVYRAFDERGAFSPMEYDRLPDLDRADDVAEVLRGLRNDLQRPALTLQPGIAAVLEALRGAAEALIARMSGSGATCFALCRNDGDAHDLARRLAAAEPGWWVRPCWVSGS